jgi:hypothetical protein
MEAVLFIVVLLLLPISAVCIYRYLQLTFELLALVQKEPALWRSLGEPRRIHVREAMPGGFQTIRPIGPWLAWVWGGEAGRAASPQIAARLRQTSRLLKSGVAFFAATLAAVALLALSAR